MTPRKTCQGIWLRHWFTYYGEPGTSAPECLRCQAPNPDYDPERDPVREITESGSGGNRPPRFEDL